jgi:hypothetical protein
MDAANAPNAQPVPAQPHSRGFAILQMFLFGVLLSQIYLNVIVSGFSVILVSYPRADFQNKTSTYYDVLHIPYNSSDTEIQLICDSMVSGNTAATSGSVNLTATMKDLEMRQACSYLKGTKKCLYDFEYLGLGFRRYIRCWFKLQWVQTRNGILALWQRFVLKIWLWNQAHP